MLLAGLTAGSAWPAVLSRGDTPRNPGPVGQEPIPASLHWTRVCRDWLSVWA